MGASSVTCRTFVWADFRKWAWWQLPGPLRAYVGAVPLAALALIALSAAHTSWHLVDLAKFSLLLGSGLISVIATPRAVFARGGVTKDFIPAWVLPTAILLPPVYAMMTPIPLYVLTHRLARRGIFHRRVFTMGAIGLSYGAASAVFRVFPNPIVAGMTGTGEHVLAWAAAVAACAVIGWLGHDILISLAVKISDPHTRLIKLELDREALQADLAEFDLGIVITIVVAVNPVLAVVAVPTVLLVRRFMMHAQLLAKSRIDTKTGLLNWSTWETEAKVEVIRAIRTGSPLSVALIDIDHFKAVNDTHGHLVGDMVLRAAADAIQEHLRSYDRAGRFGGEEFVVLLPQARQADAVSIAERLRTRIAAMSIPVNEANPDGKRVRLTVSVGVAALDDHTLELTDLMAAADAALYHAKQNGRNRTCALQTDPSAELRDQAATAAQQPASPTHAGLASGSLTGLR